MYKEVIYLSFSVKSLHLVLCLYSSHFVRLARTLRASRQSLKTDNFISNFSFSRSDRINTRLEEERRNLHGPVYSTTTTKRKERKGGKWKRKKEKRGGGEISNSFSLILFSPQEAYYSRSSSFGLSSHEMCIILCLICHVISLFFVYIMQKQTIANSGVPV